MLRNIGYVTLGTSRDTSEFACDSLRRWWDMYGRFEYPAATSILLLCDCGGSNSARYYIFKQDLQQLADEIGVEIRVAHYPPYTSKYNPIDHRLFPHLTRACHGVILYSIELLQELMAATTTTTGLRVFVSILDRAYDKGRQIAADFKETMTIRFDDFLPHMELHCGAEPSVIRCALFNSCSLVNILARSAISGASIVAIRWRAFSRWRSAG